MKIGSPFSALHSPIILGLLGLNAAQDAANVYGAVKQAHENDFLSKAYLTGQVQTSMPGSPLRHAFSRLTGGLVSPDIQASGSDLIGQQEIVNKGNLQRLQEENLQSNIAHRGVEERQRQQQIDQNNPQAKLQQKAQEERQKKEIDLGYAPQEAKIAADKAVTVAKAEAPIKMGIAAGEESARKAIDYSPGVMQAEEKLAASKKYAEIGAANAATDATPIRDVKNTTFYDAKDFSNLSAKSPGMTFKQASDMRALPVKAGSPAEQNIKSVISLHDTFDKMRKLVPSVFPTSGNPLGLRIRGAGNALHATSNEQQNAFNSYIDSAVSYVKAINGRTSTAEVQLSEDYWPKTGSPIFGHLPTSVDTQAEAYAKINKLEREADMKVRGGVFEGVKDASSDTINAAIDGAE